MSSTFDEDSDLLLVEEYLSPNEDSYNGEEGFFEKKLDHEAPIPVCDCIAFMKENKGLETEGLFRISGSQQIVKDLAAEYNQRFNSRQAKLQNDYSVLNERGLRKPVDAASLLKNFLKSLKTPLIPEDSAKKMIRVIKKGFDEQELVGRMSQIVSEMQSPNRECFSLIASFLREVVAHSATNKMNAQNLSTCLVLTLIKGNAPTIISSGARALVVILEKDVKLHLPDPKLIRRNTHYDPSLIVDQKLQAKVKSRGSFFFSRKSSVTGLHKRKDIHRTQLDTSNHSGITSSNRTLRGKKAAVKTIEEVSMKKKEQPPSSPNAMKGSLKKKKSKKLVGSKSRKLRKGMGSDGSAGSVAKSTRRGRRESVDNMSVRIERVKPSKSLDYAIAMNTKKVDTLRSKLSADNKQGSMMSDLMEQDKSSVIEPVVLKREKKTMKKKPPPLPTSPKSRGRNKNRRKQKSPESTVSEMTSSSTRDAESINWKVKSTKSQESNSGSGAVVIPPLLAKQSRVTSDDILGEI